MTDNETMTEKEMLDALQNVWYNMSLDKDRTAYGEMLRLLDNMTYFLRYDLQCEYTREFPAKPGGSFDF